MQSLHQEPHGRANLKADPTTTRRQILAYRSRKASVLRSLQESVNHHRFLLSLRPHNFASPVPAASQHLGPEMPPHDELITMSDEELRAWQKKTRSERVNLKQKEKARKTNAKVLELREELADLKRMLEERNSAEEATRTAREAEAAAAVAEEPSILELKDISDSPSSEAVLEPDIDHASVSNDAYEEEINPYILEESTDESTAAHERGGQKQDPDA
ncbi:hypothetical protein ACHAXN_008282 [Cyclotella atomus]